MKKSLGMLVLMTVIGVAVFMLFMAIRPAPAFAYPVAEWQCGDSDGH